MVNTGPGVPAAQLPHLFEPFNRQGRQRPPGLAQDGVGVSLALAQWLVGLMGGQLQIDSDEGQGTAARFSLRRPGPPAQPGMFREPGAAGSVPAVASITRK